MGRGELQGFLILSQSARPPPGRFGLVAVLQKPSFKLDPKLLPLPRHSMYGILFIYIYSLNYPNEGKNRGKQTIHGVFGLMSLPFLFWF